MKDYVQNVLDLLKYTNVKFVKKAGYYSVIGLTKILATGPDNQVARYFQNH